jgi:crotonobetainyl-CoA:carnitine CoA-transferase CaiB-like acyl-CoA transferase
MANMKKDQTVGPLAGIRVLDLSRVLAGPWASQLLADYGADVIKVERPGSGDDTRSWGPPWLMNPSGDERIDSAYYLAANRNKRSVTVNLGKPDGQRIVRDLAKSSDVLIENFKPGTLRRFGLHFAALQELNPRLVYCSLTAYGQSGSRSHLPGYDAMMQGSAGLMSITGASDDDGGSPQKVGVAITDIMAGMYAVTAILAASHARATTGEGQMIDLALYDSQVAWLANQNMNFLVGGMVPQRHGTAHPNLVPYQCFATADGFLMLAVGNESQFRALTRCLAAPELADDPRFSANASRVEHRDEIVNRLSERFCRHDTHYWLKLLQESGVPAGPINSIADIFTEPYAAERQLQRSLPHGRAGEIPTVANPVQFSSTPVQYERAPPELGQHTREVLSQVLGYSDAEIGALGNDGTI